MSAIIHNVCQWSEEYIRIRSGMMTASKASCIASRGKGLETYCRELATGTERKNFSNQHTERGHRLEPFARQAYQIETGIKIEEVGFITNPDISYRAGASPDGYAREHNGGLEIKCLIKEKHIAFERTGKVDNNHYQQMQMQILIAEYDYVDYALYNPECENSLIIKRIYRDGIQQERLLLGIKMGEKLISKYTRL